MDSSGQILDALNESEKNFYTISLKSSEIKKASSLTAKFSKAYDEIFTPKIVGLRKVHIVIKLLCNRFNIIRKLFQNIFKLSLG